MEKDKFFILIISVFLLCSCLLFSGCKSQPAIADTATPANLETATPVVTTASPAATTPAMTTAATQAQTTPQATQASKKNIALTAEVSASSFFEGFGWALKAVNDGSIDSTEESMGFTSSDNVEEQHEEWLMFKLKEKSTISLVKIYPRNDGANIGLGVPAALRIEVSDDGNKWTKVASAKDIEYDLSEDPLVYSFNAVSASYLKITAETLNPITTEADRLRFQTSEVEIY